MGVTAGETREDRISGGCAFMCEMMGQYSDFNIRCSLTSKKTNHLTPKILRDLAIRVFFIVIAKFLVTLPANNCDTVDSAG